MIQASTTTNGTTTADPTALATDALLTAIMGRVHQYFWFAYGVVILLDVLLVWAHLPEIAVGITAVFTYALYLLYKTAIFTDPLWQAITTIRTIMVRMVATYVLISLMSAGEHWVPFIVAVVIGAFSAWRQWDRLILARVLYREYGRTYGGLLDCLLIATVVIVWITNEWVGPMVVSTSDNLIWPLAQIYLWTIILIVIAQVQLLAFYALHLRGSMTLAIGQQMYAIAGIIGWFIAYEPTRERAAMWVTIVLLLGIFGSHLGRDTLLKFEDAIPNQYGNTSIAILVTVMCIWTWVWLMVWSPFSQVQGTLMSTPVNVILLVLVLLRLVELRASDGRQLADVYAQVATDSLTGCGSRLALISAMSYEPGWVLVIDIDGFSSVNDVYGHHVGDDVLRRMVQRIEARLGESGKIFRIGDDEFAVMIHDNAGDVDRIGNLLLSCTDDPFVKGLSFSIGSARFDSNQPIEALHHADAALQLVRENGRGYYLRATPEMIGQRQRVLEIRNALVHERLSGITLAWQPLFDISKPERPIVGVEALSRWHHPVLGTISPGEFIPIIEREGFSSELGVHVTRQAMKRAREWIDAGTPVQISLNISVLQLRDPAGVSALIDALRVDREAAQWIIVEVTETVSSDRSVVEILNRVRETGARIALDDFGAGAANVWRITALPADVLKIDRNLLRGVPENPASIAMLRTMVALGHDVGMQVIVEGIETELVHDHVVETGAVFGQGWLYGRPIENGEIDLTSAPSTQQLVRREVEAAYE